MTEDKMEYELIPAEAGDALYILAQESGDHVNLVTWQWNQSNQTWSTVVGKYKHKYSPRELDEAKWVIMEKTTEIIYDVTTMFGEKFTLDDLLESESHNGRLLWIR
jgi:hypothetical protein